MRFKGCDKDDAMTNEKSKFEEVLEKAKAKRDELTNKTVVRKAQDLKKEAEEAETRLAKRTLVM